VCFNIKLIQDWRIVGFGSLEKITDRTMAGPGYFKSLKELAIFMKESTMNW
jgi:hypothetical protein